jgi:hypothetical protein
MKKVEVSITHRGDVGGFDVGSKFSWQVLGALDYEICRSRTVTWSGMVGYKALSVDYAQGSGVSRYEYDVTISASPAILAAGLCRFGS